MIEEDPQKFTLEFGVQPLDGIMEKMALKNTDLVRVSSENITHKMVKKARGGRRLNPHVKQKIVNALNIFREQRGLKPFISKKIFNY